MDRENKPDRNTTMKKQRRANRSGKEKKDGWKDETMSNEQVDMRGHQNEQLVRSDKQTVSEANTPNSARTSGSWR